MRSTPLSAGPLQIRRAWQMEPTGGRGRPPTTGNTDRGGAAAPLIAIIGRVPPSPKACPCSGSLSSRWLGEPRDQMPRCTHPPTHWMSELVASAVRNVFDFIYCEIPRLNLGADSESWCLDFNLSCTYSIRASVWKIGKINRAKGKRGLESKSLTLNCGVSASPLGGR